VQLARAERLASVGLLAAGVAHEVNNPLSFVIGNLDLMAAEIARRLGARPDDALQALEAMVRDARQGADRVRTIVRDLKVFSRVGEPRIAPLDVREPLEAAIAMANNEVRHRARLEVDLAPVAAVMGEEGRLAQVFLNLLINAAQSIQEGAADRNVIRVTVRPDPDGGVRVEVSDTGVGMEPAHLARIFDPFFTTKGVGEGTGLGLSLVHGIVADFAGAIDVATQAGVGTTFTVWLPASGETPRLLAEPVGELPLGNGETVMIVDDQRSLVALAEETLAELGYEPAGFDSSVAALEAFRADPQRFDLVLTDETMPDLSGVELVREVRRVRPELPIVLMSGYSGARLTERARAAGVAELLRKPLVRRDIAEALARALRPSGDSS
jgi:CheY-like chemotaxis protein